jgi:hypothetical protein
MMWPKGVASAAARVSHLVARNTTAAISHFIPDSYLAATSLFG